MPRSLAEIATAPIRHDSIEFRGLVYEVVDVIEGKVVYRVHPAKPKRARWMTTYGWKTLCESKNVELSEYSSGPTSPNGTQT